MADEDRCVKRMQELRKATPANNKCFVCLTPGTTYALPGSQTFVCTGCSGGVMRAGQRVMSLSMAKFTPQEVDAFERGGNEVAERKYLAKWINAGPVARPPNRDQERVKGWVTNVLVLKKYYSESGVGPKKPEPASPRPSQNQQGHLQLDVRQAGLRAQAEAEARAQAEVAKARAQAQAQAKAEAEARLQAEVQQAVAKAQAEAHAREQARMRHEAAQARARAEASTNAQAMQARMQAEAVARTAQAQAMQARAQTEAERAAIRQQQLQRQAPARAPPPASSYDPFDLLAVAPAQPRASASASGGLLSPRNGNAAPLSPSATAPPSSNPWGSISYPSSSNPCDTPFGSNPFDGNPFEDVPTPMRNSTPAFTARPQPLPPPTSSPPPTPSPAGPPSTPPSQGTLPMDPATRRSARAEEEATELVQQLLAHQELLSQQVADKDRQLAEQQRYLHAAGQSARQALLSKESQLAGKEQELQQVRQQLAEREHQLTRATSVHSARSLLSPWDGGLLKQPPVRNQSPGRACSICMDALPEGSIVYMQKACSAFFCQGCAIGMARSRAASSGTAGNNNGEIMCTFCSPPHPIHPATLARTIPAPVFKELQVALSREELCGSFRSIMSMICRGCNNTAAVAAGMPFFVCTSAQCAAKENVFCIFCRAPWTPAHTCQAPIDLRTVEAMLHEESITPDDQLQNVLVCPCPACPPRICTKDPNVCYHMTCSTCGLNYCGVCSFIKSSSGNSWQHQCVDSSNIYRRSEPRRQAVLNSYLQALALE